MVDLVTGGAGFIGGHLVRQLRAEGRTVRVLDLNEPAPGVDWHSGSITEGETVARAVQGVERVFHLAGIAQLWARDPAVFEHVNHQGTRSVLDAAVRVGVTRFVHCSSEVVLIGRSAGMPPLSVDATLDLPEAAMLGPYARSKWRAERAVRHAARAGLPAVIVNPSAPIGPDDPTPTPPTRLLRDLARGALPAYYPTVLNLVDVEDAARGHIRAAACGEIGARYLLHAHAVAFADFARLIGGLTGAKPPRLALPYPLVRLIAGIDEGLASFVTKRPPRAPIEGVRLARYPVRLDGAASARALGLRYRPLAESARAALGLEAAPAPNTPIPAPDHT